MSPLVFMPGFDGSGALRAEFADALREQHHAVRVVSYPREPLGSLDRYREHAMGHAPVDWQPVLVAESFSGLVAARWAALDPRVRGLVLCGSFARNPVGPAAALGASWPSLVQRGPALFSLFAQASGDGARQRWSAGLTAAMQALPPEVIAERLRLIATEDVGPILGALSIPVLLVHFDADRVIGAAARAHLESVCHNAQVLRLPGPHFAIATRPRACAEAIGERIRTLHGRKA
jgi:pimeloyl-ACP methyl ester carboxylesterase